MNCYKDATQGANREAELEKGGDRGHVLAVKGKAEPSRCRLSAPTVINQSTKIVYDVKSDFIFRLKSRMACHVLS